MEKLDGLVADHIEHRLLLPSRLEKILSSVLDRREERAERQTVHIAELRKRAAETDAKLKRLYDAIENGVTDLSDLMLKDRIAELKAIRDQARADAERAEGAIERQGRRDYLRALAQRVEVDAQELRIMGSKNNCFARSSPLQAQKRRVLACPVLYRSGAPRPMKMSTIASQWRYDAGAYHTLDPRIRERL